MTLEYDIVCVSPIDGKVTHVKSKNGRFYVGHDGASIIIEDDGVIYLYGQVMARCDPRHPAAQ